MESSVNLDFVEPSDNDEFGDQELTGFVSPPLTPILNRKVPTKQQFLDNSPQARVLKMANLFPNLFQWTQVRFNNL